ncbi:MAG TPA: glycosyltransferase family 4 protein [Anaerolineaceae bacterium]
MRILFLAQIIPYPLDAGPKVKTWNVLRYLVGCGHKVTFVSYVRPEELAYVGELKALCSEVHVVPLKRQRVLEPLYLARSVLTGRPFLIERDDRKAMRDLVARLATEKHYDVIHADQINMPQFAEYALRYAADPKPALIFDAHNAVWVILDRSAKDTRWFLKPLLGMEARKMRAYEGRLVRDFDCTMAVSEVDRRYLLEAAEAANGKRPLPQIPVIPIAVNTQELQPVTRRNPSKNILTLGTLHYPPNAEGIRWFLQEVFPLVKARIPAATIAILGKHPPKDFQDLAAGAPETYLVPGYVPDLTGWLEKAAVMVVPVRVGGGMRVRILEAFARGMPVVTTTIGLEGIDARVGEDVLVEDDPQRFADAVVRVLEDTDLQDTLAKNSRKLAEERYDWKVVLDQLEQVYRGIEQQRAGLKKTR